MPTRSTPYQEAIDHLPEGAILVLQDVPWEDYEQLLNDVGSRRPGLRMTYDHGRLEVMSPLRKHEKYKEFIVRLVDVLTDELGLPLESSGSTTWRNKKNLTAFEPDACFHIARAREVIGKEELEMGVDPPPDLAVEIDVTNESSSKFPLYAAYGVPEVWRYVSKRKTWHIYALRHGVYEEVPASPSFPLLNPGVLASFIDRSTSLGQSKALAAFRLWVRGSLK
jgi:Uma2 family endonuclease